MNCKSLYVRQRWRVIVLVTGNDYFFWSRLRYVMIHEKAEL